MTSPKDIKEGNAHIKPIKRLYYGDVLRPICNWSHKKGNRKQVACVVRCMCSAGAPRNRRMYEIATC